MMVWVFYTHIQSVLCIIFFPSHQLRIVDGMRAKKNTDCLLGTEKQDWKQFSNNLLVFVHSPRDVVIAMLKTCKEVERKSEKKSTRRLKPDLFYVRHTFKNLHFNHTFRTEKLREFASFHQDDVACSTRFHIINMLCVTFSLSFSSCSTTTRTKRKNNQRHENKHHDLCIRQDEHNSNGIKRRRNWRRVNKTQDELTEIESQRQTINTERRNGFESTGFGLQNAVGWHLPLCHSIANHYNENNMII